MPRMDGFEFLRTLREQGRAIPAIVLTGFGSLEKALSVIRDLEAYWFLEKPVKLGALQPLLQRAIGHSRLMRETERLKARPGIAQRRSGGLVGRSSAMQDVFSLIRQAAPRSVSILLIGESGTGKELAAREIHNLSLRANQPFVAVNCAALPETLIESELFGHEKGAFTGAFERRPGCFEQAEGGTIFLDEITEMPPATQSKLLRALEERSVRRLGGKAEIPVDVRVIAATNRQPEEALRDNQLRGDSVLPAQRVSDRAAAFAHAGGGHSAVDRIDDSAAEREARDGRLLRLLRRCWSAAANIPGRAMCGNFAT